MVTTKMER